MNDHFGHYDIKKLPGRIKKIRQLRYEQYKEYLKNPDHTPSEYKNYENCKSQEKLAEAIGVKRQTIIDWEKGYTLPPLNNLIKLCTVFNCNMDYLIGSIETPVTEDVSIAHYFSRISSEIIAYGLKHQDYLDCLNFFMKPENCASLFNDITITAWRNFWTESSLSDIKSPLKEDIINAYNEYSATTPINQISKASYKSFLENKFPKNKLILKKEPFKNGYRIKSCFQPVIYQNFFIDKEFHYPSFIKYLVDNTFEPLSHNALIESQMIKLSKAFIDLFIKYINEK